MAEQSVGTDCAAAEMGNAGYEHSLQPQRQAFVRQADLPFCDIGPSIVISTLAESERARFTIAELRAFLQARDDQPLPEKVESFIKTNQKQGKALRIIGTTLLIDCEDAETAAMIATRKEAAGLCLRAGDRQLVVRLENEEKFRALIRILGLGITT